MSLQKCFASSSGFTASTPASWTLWSSRHYDAGGIDGEKQYHGEVLASPRGRDTKHTAGILVQDHGDGSGDLEHLKQKLLMVDYW